MAFEYRKSFASRVNEHHDATTTFPAAQAIPLRRRATAMAKPSPLNRTWLWLIPSLLLRKAGVNFACASFAAPDRSIRSRTRINRGRRKHHLFYADRDRNFFDGKNNGNRDDFDEGILSDRLERLRVRNLEEEFRRPPNPNLTPTEFVQECLHCLWANGDPLPDSGFRLLLRVSTETWRKQLLRSVGAPAAAHEEVVASALGEAIARPNNQFGILVGEGETYSATFPTDPLDYADGTCWVECQLREVRDNTLLVITGWQLEKENGAWMVDGIDWQDFRDSFRPGIGREEWMRICG